MYKKLMEPGMSTLALRSSGPRFPIRLFSFTLFLLLLTASAMADSHARIVRLSYIDGDVEIDKGDGRGFNPAYMNMPVIYQSKVWARDGQAEIELEDGSSIRLTPETIVSFADLSLDADGSRKTAVELTQGTAYFDIRRRDADSFHLSFGRESVELAKSAHFRVDIDKQELDLAVFSGEVQIGNSSGSEVAVKKGETIRLDSESSDQYDLAKGIDVENYDSWDSQRAGGHDQSVANAVINGVDNGLTYGLSDLDASGNYFFVPGYGYMWRPAGTGLAWDPFANGYWVQYPGVGYTFVSGYSWGWTPYRYGSWQYLNGYGWCWAPGSTWTAWQTVPPYRNPPPHFRPVVPPHNGSGVMVVTNGVTSPAPSHRMVVDNDVLAHPFPRAAKITAQNGEVIRQGQPIPPAAAKGFVGGPSAATVQIPAVSAVSPTANIPAIPARNVVPVMPPGHHEVHVPEVHPPATSSVSRTEPHIASSPARMSAPSSSATRMSGPSMSSGGMHVSAPSMSVGGSGGHSSSGGHR
jgi:hypothetical protein